MKKRSIFWGVVFVCAAVMLVISQVRPTLFEDYSPWQLVLGILLVPILLDALWHLNFMMTFLSLGWLAWMFAEPTFGIHNLGFWPLMGAAVLLGIGFEAIFHGAKKKRKWCGKWHGYSGKDVACHEERWFQDRTEQHLDGEKLYFNEKFGEASKYLHSANLKQVTGISAFGALNLHFNDCTLHEGAATVYLNNKFGAIRLFVPRTWRIHNNVDTFAGDVDFSGRPVAAEDPPTLILEGDVKFGAVEVKYV